MQWYNQPSDWSAQDNRITVTADPKTDFWRTTHYGFIRDSGHFYYQDVQGDFTCTVKVGGAYRNLYDQAGLMVRADETTWLKCGIEYVHQVQHASVVVTRDFSDWSVVQLSENPPAIWLQLKRTGGAVEIAYSIDSTSYTMLRLAYLTEAKQVQVGVMCAAPEGPDFSVTFEDFRVS